MFANVYYYKLLKK